MEAVVKEKVPSSICPISDSTVSPADSSLVIAAAAKRTWPALSKELKDLFGGGDAEWGDWRADRVGIACARSASDDDEPRRSAASKSGY